MPRDANGKGELKDRLLPPPAWVAWVEKLLERLPRRRVEVSLQPVRDVQVLSAEQGDFRASGTAPSFQLRSGAPWQAGWYYLETALARNNGSRVAKLVLHGSGEDLVVEVPGILRGSIREVFFVPDGVTAIEWVPTAARGLFSQAPLLLHRIGVVESAWRRTYRVLCDLARFGGSEAAAAAGLSWRNALLDLSRAYRASAQLRIARAGGDYDLFLARNGAPTAQELRQMRQRIEAMASPVLVSLLMPLRHADPDLLQQTLASFRAQVYPCGELVAVCAPDVGAEALAALTSCAAGEPRVRLLRAEGSGGRLNQGLAASRGDWLMRLDAHDLLPTDALYRLVDRVQAHPEAELVYGDDDDVGATGRRSQPRFKPDWNPDLLESHDYLGRGIAYRSSVLQSLGGFEERLEGAEDYDLALRFLRRRAAGTVQHVHRIVYHRRQPAAEGEQVERADAAARLALELHFAGTGAVVERGAGPSLFRVRRRLPEPAPLVSLIVPTRDQVALLRSCVQSVRHKTLYPSWELLIVDNGSVEPETLSYLQLLQDDPRIRVLRYPAPFNFPALNNYAVQHARGELLVLLNNDVEAIAPDWLAEMVSHAVRPEVGAVGAKLLYPDHTVQHAGVVLGIGGVAGHVHRFLPADDPGYCHRAAVTQGLSAVTGACLAVRKSVYQQVGGMDDRHLLVAFNDIDFCLKLLDAGYRNVFTPWALLYHHESVSRGMDDTPEKKEVFRREFEHMRRRWAPRLQEEPAYNRNLSMELENFSIKA